jgi:hypothetical protein
MLIQIDPTAQDYIFQNGGKAMVIMGSMRGCCGGAISLPKIELGSPKNPSEYKENQIGSVTLYVDKKLMSHEAMQVTFAKLLWAKKLSVEVQ